MFQTKKVGFLKLLHGQDIVKEIFWDYGDISGSVESLDAKFVD